MKLIFMGSNALAEGFALLGFETFPAATLDMVENVLAELLKKQTNALIFLEDNLVGGTAFLQVRSKSAGIIITEIPALNVPDNYCPSVEELVDRILGPSINLSLPRINIMEDTLKRLLIVETESEQLVTKSKLDKEQIIQQALTEAHQIEQQFKAKIPDIHASFMQKSKERAVQNIAELDKRYEERKSHLRELAITNQQKALEAAVQIITQV
jgi:vacuolar-type H+-ATPase subunit F/Vma7/vacuolar-type H+-ATPase subunit H